MADREYVEGKLQRSGCSSEAREYMNHHAEQFTNWWGQCRKCGQRVEGKLSDLREHMETCNG